MGPPIISWGKASSVRFLLLLRRQLWFLLILLGWLGGSFFLIPARPQRVSKTPLGFSQAPEGGEARSLPPGRCRSRMLGIVTITGKAGARSVVFSLHGRWSHLLWAGRGCGAAAGHPDGASLSPPGAAFWLRRAFSLWFSLGLCWNLPDFTQGRPGMHFVKGRTPAPGRGKQPRRPRRHMLDWTEFESRV